MASPPPASSDLTVPSTSTTSSGDSTAKTDSHSTTTTNAPSIPYEESVGRHVSRKELPADVQARIERNRLAALERRAKYQKRLDSERSIAQQFGEVLPLPSLASAGGESGAGYLTSAIIEKNAAEIHKAMEEVEPLPKNEWTKFYDYDLSKMKDTRAGFIQVIDDDKKRDAEDENSKKRKWEPTLAQPDPSIFLGADDNYECQDCTSIDVDFQLLRYFHVPVCIGCRDAQPEKYSLLTKTECRADYLLTDPELRDTDLFSFWERPNPKKSTWNNMMLYLRCQVEEFAFKKWGGPEGLDKEFEKREREKEARKEVKFKKELRDLRNKTRTSVWQDKRMQQRPKIHKHNFGTALVDPESGASVQTCVECGIQVECEEF
ncbi:DNA repair protein [Linnemannia elongata AG-77]|uniref:DNA repair protein n=1 Tax=Linnemannia elongata AG-77 TaxID=1314771 RepID=A0A197JWJ5_9FUNG|nr:DNA repair protein [Linnemannia elongata AG-77]